MAIQNITTHRGNAIILVEPVLNPDGTAFIFTGSVVQCTIKAITDVLPDDSGALARLQWTFASSTFDVGIAVNTGTGVVTVTIPPAVTAQMLRGRTYVYDVVLTDSSGNPFTITSGTIVAQDAVTLSPPR